MGESVEVIVQGPGHHDRAARAVPLIEAVARLGVEVVVDTDLRPRLADDMRALLTAGAESIRLAADGIEGRLVSTEASRSSSNPDLPVTQVRFVLRAGSMADPLVNGRGELADAVRTAVDRVEPAAGSST